MSTKDPVAPTLETAARWRDAPAPEVVGRLQNLTQVYAVLTDAGRAEELAELFTSDASWDGEELGYGSARGPADIASTVLAHFDPARPMMHVPGAALLLRMLSYYISWHMKHALAPILFTDNDKPAAAAKRADPVAPAQRSDEALSKAARANAPTMTTRCTASPACSPTWPPSAPTTFSPPTT